MKEYLVYYHLHPMIGKLIQPYHVEVFKYYNGLGAEDFVKSIDAILKERYGNDYSVQITDIKLFE